MLCVSSEKLPPWADKRHGIYLARRSYFLLLCVRGNGGDCLIRSCHAEGRASSSNKPGVVGKAQTRHKASCWPSVAVSVCPSVMGLRWPRGTSPPCLALGGEGLAGCIPSVLLVAPLSSGGP